MQFFGSPCRLMVVCSMTWSFGFFRGNNKLGMQSLLHCIFHSAVSMPCSVWDQNEGIRFVVLNRVNSDFELHRFAIL